MTSQAIAAAQSAGLEHRVIRHGPVRSLAEAAQARGVEPADVVKTMVVRRGPGDHLVRAVGATAAAACGAVSRRRRRCG